jgi:DNA topoisomerase I
VTHNGVNATLPQEKTPESITLDEAVVLLEARAARGEVPGKRRAPARKAPAKRAAAGRKTKTAAAKSKPKALKAKSKAAE